jgi:hypothetical protein
MEDYGLVRLERGARGRIAPKVVYDRVALDLSLTLSRKRAEWDAQFRARFEPARSPLPNLTTILSVHFTERRMARVCRNFYVKPPSHWATSR